MIIAEVVLIPLGQLRVGISDRVPLAVLAGPFDRLGRVANVTALSIHVHGASVEPLSLFRIRTHHIVPPRYFRTRDREDQRRPIAKTGIASTDVLEGMCQYCSYVGHDGWTRLLEYDDVYQNALPDRTADQSTHGFHESWEELSEELES